MCGIIGYDSAGIAIKNDATQETNVYKCAGRVSDLRAICEKKRILSIQMNILLFRNSIF